ncbi:bifunctional tRNA (adenosine(37)-N6)-threonylcarbamoyltransferase complex dimerization subunit type 1 TsaB/ribosomal-protein-alanine acetyltransferase RimI [Bordetella genomosp. 8]|uniref:[Ribosomal protein bS18]-alanine N-acetyltransferase n=1 Tax=Bordetella genomosp. 8 TaxID=1416806 RepID=A0A1W6YP62_9BORD|nr:tRNA (adenosine(37)-N6)-threonylcarbamoyltransferase complex dimerization subunit type 1 TsaB [Bordetella genomosp. 8]ARP82794.1 bifunctional tRNA (adenosine(37)-N6)-threonylcarbamoyltransferase complex dimerization subunit type 1 TsaB/ribosomal-protein-alanine acetyltransferase RimI [Bordetella genomosp. 8]
MNPTLLALETSSSRCSVALLRDLPGGPAIATLEHEGAQEHAERLLPMARDLLRDAGLEAGDIQAVAFGQGPGGFTGLRVACGVAQGIAMAHELPVVPIVSHLAVAAQVPARPDQAIVVALDARMEEVYLAVYRRAQGAADDTAWEVLAAPLLIAAAEVVPWVEARLLDWRARTGLALSPVLAGDAWDAYARLMAPHADWARYDAMRPHARDVARLALMAWRKGDTVPPEQAMPLYVRDRVAFTTAERLAGQGGNPKAAQALVPDQAARTLAPDHAAQAAASHPAPPPADALPIEMSPMTEQDLDDMDRIEASVQAFPWTRRNFADALAAGYDSCVLRRAGRMLGFCILMHAPDVSHLLVVAIDKTMHRQGLGSRLIKWCVERARQRGIGGVLLEVRPSNTGAVAFYGHHGFLRVGLRRGYYPAGRGRREDALVMQKPVTLDEVGHG